MGCNHLESLVLKNTLDGGILSSRRKLGLEHHAERSIANNLALRVLQISGLACDAVLNFLADNL